MKTIITNGKSEYLDGLREDNVFGFLLAIDETETAFTSGNIMVNEKDYIEFDKNHLNSLTAYGKGIIGATKGTNTLYFVPWSGTLRAFQMTMPNKTDVIVLYKKNFFRVKHAKLPDGTHVTPVRNGHHVIITSTSGSGNIILRYPTGASVFTYSDGVAISKAIYQTEGYGVGFSLGGQSLEIETDFAGYITIVEIRPDVEQALRRVIGPAPIRRPIKPIPRA